MSWFLVTCRRRGITGAGAEIARRSRRLPQTSLCRTWPEKKKGRF